MLVSVREGKLNDAMQLEAAMRKIVWVIELPGQMLKELAQKNGGDNT